MDIDAKQKHIVDLNILNTYNKSGCEACHQKFNLGDTVVLACGPWKDDCAKFIHADEAVFDAKTETWYERNYYKTKNS